MGVRQLAPFFFVGYNVFMKNKGSFLVIEGTDGSGKATQIKLLSDWMTARQIPFEVVDFPQYGQPSAYFVEKYLRGEYGTLEQVGAYRGSIFYALDRYEKSFDVRRWISEGKTVISNRYVSASMGHQGGKIKDPKEREKFLKWLEHLEYEIFDIPKPDLTVLLYMPPEIGQKLVDQKSERAYTQGKKRDIHEADLEHLIAASKVYLEIAKKNKWKVVHCTEENGSVRTKEDINEVIKELVGFK